VINYNTMKKEIKYPAPITFKSVFVDHPDISHTIRSIFIEHKIECRVTHRFSKNSKFVSYTISAEFASESDLNDICAGISAIQGFIMMF